MTMITKECKHTLPKGFSSSVVTISAPSYSCIFCEIERLNSRLALAELDNERLRASLRYLRQKIDGYDTTFEHCGYEEFADGK